MIKFIVESDLHFSPDIKEYKKDNVKKIIDICKQHKIHAIICPGDLTEHGWNGAHFLCWKYGGKVDELTPLKNNYVVPLERITKVYLCSGNHDTYVPWPYIRHPVLDLIKSKHGDLRYSFDIENLHFICLDLYPDKKSIKFLKKDLKKNLDKPIVIFFHYNLIGNWSDWWSDMEKDIFHQTIKDYDVKAILVGHAHVSQITEWKGYKIISGASSKIAYCTFDGKEIKVEFV